MNVLKNKLFFLSSGYSPNHRTLSRLGIYTFFQALEHFAKCPSRKIVLFPLAMYEFNLVTSEIAIFLKCVFAQEDCIIETKGIEFQRESF